MDIHHPDYRSSPAAAEDARYDTFMAAMAANLPPVISLVKTDLGRRAVTARMLEVTERRIAGDGEISEAFIATQFTREEIDACWPLVLKRLRPSIRDLALAA
jgi:hypothetical protein